MQIIVKNVNRNSGRISFNGLLLLLICATAFVATFAKEENDSDKNFFQGQKLSWKDDDGLEIKIIRPIAVDKCTIKSQAGDIVEQYYKLSEADGKEIGSNFGKTP